MAIATLGNLKLYIIILTGLLSSLAKLDIISLNEYLALPIDTEIRANAIRVIISNPITDVNLNIDIFFFISCSYQFIIN